MAQKSEMIDVLVIGAGPAGTVAASILAKNGLRVTILEKQQFPRFVIGESMLPRCMDNLEEAGFIETIEGAGFQKKHGAKFIHGREKCAFDFSVQHTDGWSWTWQVKRADFDHLLAKEAEKKGVTVEYQKTVTNVSFDDSGRSRTTYADSEGNEAEISARFLVDASGYGRVLPRLLDLDQPAHSAKRSSLFCHLIPTAAPDDTEKNQIIIIVYTKDVWGWVIPFSDGTSSIGLVGEMDELHKFSGSNEEILRQWIEEIPALRERFTGSEIVFGPKTITGFAAAVKKQFGKGFVLTGNSAEFVDPIFSSGTTIATESGAKAAGLIVRHLNGEEVDWQVEFSDYIGRGVDVFRTFVDNWYDGVLQKIIFRDIQNESLTRQICSILAGYVWDLENPLVVKHKRAIPTIAHIVDMNS